MLDPVMALVVFWHYATWYLAIVILIGALLLCLDLFPLSGLFVQARKWTRCIASRMTNLYARATSNRWALAGLSTIRTWTTSRKPPS